MLEQADKAVFNKDFLPEKKYVASAIPALQYMKNINTLNIFGAIF